MKRLHANWLPTQPAPEPSSVREELIARVRREIDDGTYDCPAKLEAALERMLARLAQE